MSDIQRSNTGASTLAEVRAAAEALLLKAAGQEIADSDLFPYGITHIEVEVKAGDVEVSVEISGPEHPHGGDEDEWDEDELDDMFDGDETT